MMNTNTNAHEHNQNPTGRKPIVLVTGSSGLIGSAIIDALCRRYQIVGVDLNGNPHGRPEAETVCVDLTDDASVRNGLRRVRHAYGDRIASVIHLAAYFDFEGEPSDLYDEVTVRGTGRMLSGLQEEGFTVEQFLFSSTMLAHRPTRPGSPIDESAPLEGKWDYPESKVKTERLIREERGAIPAVILRIAGVYTDECDSIPLSHQIQRIAENRITAHVFPGDVSHGQSFVHIDDLVSAVALCVTRRREIGEEETFLIGEPETYSYDRLQRAIAELTRGEEEWTTESIPKSVAKSGAWVQGKIPGLEEPFIKPWMVDLADDHYEIDISKAERLLNWKPEHRLIDALPRMIEALGADPAGWCQRHGLETPRRDALPRELPASSHVKIEL